MATVRVEITALSDYKVSPTIKFGGYKFNLWDKDGTVIQENKTVSELFVVFENVAEGAHFVSIFAVSTAGEQLGGSISTSFVIAPEDILIQVPSGISFTIL